MTAKTNKSKAPKAKKAPAPKSRATKATKAKSPGKPREAKKAVPGPASPAKKRPAKETKKKAKSSRVKARAVKARTFPPRKIEEFREHLQQTHRDLLHSYTNARGDSRNRQADGTEDYIDYAVTSYDREFLLSLTELDRKQLVLVEDALKRLDRPREFGRCMQCGQEIPIKRLEVQPWARYCVTCQELEDAGQLVNSDLDLDEDDDSADDAAETEHSDDDAAEEADDEEVELVDDEADPPTDDDDDR